MFVVGQVLGEPCQNLSESVRSPIHDKAWPVISESLVCACRRYLFQLLFFLFFYYCTSISHLVLASSSFGCTSLVLFSYPVYLCISSIFCICIYLFFNPLIYLESWFMGLMTLRLSYYFAAVHCAIYEGLLNIAILIANESWRWIPFISGLQILVFKP